MPFIGRGGSSPPSDTESQNRRPSDLRFLVPTDRFDDVNAVGVGNAVARRRGRSAALGLVRHDRRSSRSRAPAGPGSPRPHSAGWTPRHRQRARAAQRRRDRRGRPRQEAAPVDAPDPAADRGPGRDLRPLLRRAVDLLHVAGEHPVRRVHPQPRRARQPLPGRRVLPVARGPGVQALPTWLEANGYGSALLGKYLNEYPYPGGYDGTEAEKDRARGVRPARVAVVVQPGRRDAVPAARHGPQRQRRGRRGRRAPGSSTSSWVTGCSTWSTAWTG